MHLPSQWSPSPWYPGKHVQPKLPNVFVQWAKTSQGRYLHSFSSEKIIVIHSWNSTFKPKLNRKNKKKVDKNVSLNKRSFYCRISKAPLFSIHTRYHALLLLSFEHASSHQYLNFILYKSAQSQVINFCAIAVHRNWIGQL